MLSDILLMVLEAVGGFFTMMLLVRTVMRAMRISFVNQVGQFTLATTNWIVLPCQRVLPSMGRLDLSSLLPAWVIQTLLVVCSVLLSGRSFGNPGMAIGGLLTIGALELLRSALYLLMGAVILGAVLSWVNPYSPVAPAVNHLTRPFLDPFRRIMPTVSGIDLSPLVLLLVVQIVLFVLQSVRASFTPLLFF